MFSQIGIDCSKKEDCPARYFAFKKIISLNQKVWPTKSSCNLELKKCNNVLGDWMLSNQRLIQSLTHEGKVTQQKDMKSRVHGDVSKCGSLSGPI